MSERTRRSIQRALAISALASEDGVIQAGDMLKVSSHPTHHTTCSLQQAWEWSGLSPIDFGVAAWNEVHEIVWTAQPI